MRKLGMIQFIMGEVKMLLLIVSEVQAGSFSVGWCLGWILIQGHAISIQHASLHHNTWVISHSHVKMWCHRRTHLQKMNYKERDSQMTKLEWHVSTSIYNSIHIAWVIELILIRDADGVDFGAQAIHQDSIKAQVDETDPLDSRLNLKKAQCPRLRTILKWGWSNVCLWGGNAYEITQGSIASIKLKCYSWNVEEGQQDQDSACQLRSWPWVTIVIAPLGSRGPLLIGWQVVWSMSSPLPLQVTLTNPFLTRNKHPQYMPLRYWAETKEVGIIQTSIEMNVCIQGKHESGFTQTEMNTWRHEKRASRIVISPEIWPAMHHFDSLLRTWFWAKGSHLEIMIVSGTESLQHTSKTWQHPPIRGLSLTSSSNIR